jgi:hypothetical protein
MRRWVLAIPFTGACVASGVNLILWATVTPLEASRLELVAFYSSPIVCYAMLLMSVFLERRYFELRSHPLRSSAYTFVLISNAFVPSLFPLFFIAAIVGLGEGFAGVYAVFGGFLFPLLALIAGGILCFFKDHSPGLLYRMLPVGFALLGAAVNWRVALQILLSIQVRARWRCVRRRGVR